MSWINNFLRDRNVGGKVFNEATGQWEAGFNPWSGISTMLGNDPQAAVNAWDTRNTSEALHNKAVDSGYSYDELDLDPNQTLIKGQVGNAIQKAREKQKGASDKQWLTRLKAQQAPGVLASENVAKATSESTQATKEIALQQLLSGDKNAAAERLQQLTMAENADIRAQQQWLRQMEYMDRKDQSLKEEKELETLIAGLSMLGANLFV